MADRKGRAPNKVIWNMQEIRDYLDLAWDELHAITLRAERQMDTPTLRAAAMMGNYLNRIGRHVDDARYNRWREGA